MSLQQVDTVVAFAMIMLLLSLVITAAVQVVVSILGLRGKNLVGAMTQLLKEADPGLKDQAEGLAQRVLSHPAVSTTTNWLLWLIDRFLMKEPRFNHGKRAPTAIREDDIVRILDQMDPNSQLGTRLKAGIHDWFETVMDAATEKFKLWSSWITVAGAFVLGFGYQVDSIETYNKLSRDPEMRAAVLASTDTVKELYRQVQEGEKAEKAKAGTAETVTADLEDAKRSLDRVLGAVESVPIIELRWTGREDLLFKAPGKLLTVLLLSLGAPFWFGTLKNLASLRSVVARKSEEQQSQANTGQVK